MLTLVHNHFSFLMIEPDHWLQQKLKNSDSLLRLCDVISTFIGSTITHERALDMR